MIQFQPNRKKKLVLVYRNAKKIGAIHTVKNGFQYCSQGKKPSDVGKTFQKVDDCKEWIQNHMTNEIA